MTFLHIRELITFFGMLVSVQIVICFDTDDIILVDVFLERKPAQLTENYDGPMENILQSKSY